MRAEWATELRSPPSRVPRGPFPKSRIIVGLPAAAIPLYVKEPSFNIQAVEGCMVAYNQHHPRGPLYAPRYDVAGRAERWI